MQVGIGARDRGDAGGHRDHDGQEVVDDEGARRDETGYHAEVLARDDVAATTLRIRADHLQIADDHDREDDDDGDRERHVSEATNAAPASARMRIASSVAYADDEMLSDAKMASP